MLDVTGFLFFVILEYLLLKFLFRLSINNDGTNFVVEFLLIYSVSYFTFHNLSVLYKHFSLN